MPVRSKPARSSVRVSMPLPNLFRNFGRGSTGGSADTRLPFAASLGKPPALFGRPSPGAAALPSLSICELRPC